MKQLTLNFNNMKVYACSIKVFYSMSMKGYKESTVKFNCQLENSMFDWRLVDIESTLYSETMTCSTQGALNRS
jgi:hypothetical protein